MMARLPYAMLTKLISMKGMKRFELNRVLRFANISEQKFYTIYRRSLVINLHANFIPEKEYRILPKSDAAASGVFAKDDSLKSFLSSPPAGAAFLQILFSFMNRNSASQCAERIDTYSRTEGTTWAVMRFACNLPTSRPDFKIGGGIFDPVLDEKTRLVELSAALALEALSRNIDVSACSLPELWRSLQSPHPVAAPHGKEESKKIFDDMLKAGLWIAHGKTYKLTAIYCPAIRTRCPASELFGDDKGVTSCAYKEKANVGELKAYASHPSRWENSRVWGKYYKAQSDSVAVKRGRLNRKDGSRHYVDEKKDLDERADRESNILAEVSQIVSACAQLSPANKSGVFAYECNYGPGPSGYIGRLYAKNYGAQRISRRLRQIAYQGLDVRDFDMEAAHFTIAVQAVGKLQIDMTVPYYKLENVQHYLLNKTETWGKLALDYKDGKFRPWEYFKKLCTSVFLGTAVPPHHAKNETLQGISREGRFMRWLATSFQPDLYAKLCADTDRKWPESSAHAFLLQRIEARILHCLRNFASSHKLHHISLQFDGADIMISPPPPNFREDAQLYIFRQCGYNVNLAEKEHYFFGDYLAILGAKKIPAPPPNKHRFLADVWRLNFTSLRPCPPKPGGRYRNYKNDGGRSDKRWYAYVPRAYRESCTMS